MHISVFFALIPTVSALVKDIEFDTDLEFVPTARKTIKDKLFYKIRLLLKNMFNTGMNDPVSCICQC